MLGTGLPFLLLVILFYFYYASTRQKIEETYVAKAQAICYTTESIRDSMERKWELGVFTKEQARAYSDTIADASLPESTRKMAKEKLLQMVPVVTAWQSAMAKAEAGEYTFKVPKHQPRNPKNEPDSIETEALAYMEANDVDDYVFNDGQSIRYFRSIKLTQSCMMCHGDPATAQALWGTDGTDPTGSRMENWSVGDRTGAFEIIQSLEPATKALRASMLNGALVALAGLIILSVVITIAAKSIAKPITDSVVVVESLAGGDLTASIAKEETDRKDEAGRLGLAVNRMAEHLRGIVGEIRSNSASLSSASSELSATADELASSSGQTSARSQNVASAGEELSVTLAGMSTSARDIDQSMQMVATSVEQMSASIREVAESCARENQIADQANTNANQALKLIEELGDSALRVGEIVDIIDQIAAKTNLLALNATIEAASAGEAGKGFAVVANEVKGLARQTADSTHQIVEQIKDIQNKTDLSVIAVRDVVAVIEEVSLIASTIAAAVEEQSATSADMVTTLGRVSGSTTELANHIEESSKGASEVSSNISGVTQEAAQTNSSASQMRASSEELAQMANRLRALIDQFKV